jgi:hypothetical protein
LGGRFSEFKERRDEYETDESKYEHKESVDEKGWEKTNPEEWMKEVAKEIEEQEAEERLKAEKLVKEVRKDLERQERIEAEERRAAEEWMKEVAKEIEKKDHENELERELRRAERVLHELEADEVADYAGRENWPTPKRRYEVYRGDVTGEGKSNETEEVDEVAKKAVKELDETEASEAQSESKESTNVKRTKGWDPTKDELDDYEKDIAKAYEKTGATEEEMKERWRERYVNEMQNIMDKEPPPEESSSDSLEGTMSSKGRESKDSEEQSEEYVESGDGTASSMVIEQPSKEPLEQDESESENPSENETGDTPNDTTESSESTLEEEDIGAKNKETSHESASEKKEDATYTERPTHHRREIDSYSKEENSEPSEKFREEYESRLKPTQFSEEDRTPESLSRVVDQVEKSSEYQKLPSLMDGQVEGYSEPSIGKLEHSEKPIQETSQQEVYEDNIEDIPSKEMVHEYNSEQSIDSKENPPHQDECNNESKVIHETTKNLEVMEEDYTETKDVQESSDEYELHQDELIEVTSETFENESEVESESSYEYSEIHLKEVLEGKGQESPIKQELDHEYSEDDSEPEVLSESCVESFQELEKEEDSNSLHEDIREEQTHEDVIDEQRTESTSSSSEEYHSQTEEYERQVSEHGKTREQDELDERELTESEESSDSGEPIESENKSIDETTSSFDEENTDSNFENSDISKILAPLGLLIDDDLQELLDRHPDLKMETDYEESLEDALEYLQLKQRVRELHIDGLDADEIAKQLQVDSDRVKDLLNNKHLPTLIWKIRTLETERIWKEHIIAFSKRWPSGTEEQAHRKTKTKSQIKAKTVPSSPSSRFIDIQWPEYNGIQIASFIKLNKLIDSHALGLKHNPHFSKYMRKAKTYFEVMQIFSNQHIAASSTISSVAQDKGISVTCVRSWILKGIQPSIFRIFNKSFKNQQCVEQIREKLGEFQSAEDVRKKLKDTGMFESIERWSTSEKQWSALKSFYQALSLLESGMLQCDVDRQLGLPATSTKRWIDGSLPWPVRIVVTPNSERSMIQRRKLTVNVYRFNIDGITLPSPARLKSFITKQYPLLMDLDDFDSLISDYESYYKLLVKLDNVLNIRHSELVEIAKELNITDSTARRWAIDGKKPQLCTHIERAILNKQLIIKLREILPIQSKEEYFQIMNNLYIAPHLKNWSNYTKIENYLTKYYKFLDLYEAGDTQENISDLLEIDETTIYHWTKGRFPRAISLLQRCPQKQPRGNWKWLPTRLDGRIFSNYIEVPRKVSNHSEVVEVLSQLNMNPHDIMYVIGFTVSDGYVQRTSKTSYSLRSTLSQKYNWSKLILDDVSDSLSSLKPCKIYGVNRPNDDVWELENPSPLFIWIREAILELDKDGKKTYSPLIAEWILNSPEQFRIAFLQGLADGDGYASPIAQRIGIASLVNGNLIQDILETLGINSVKATNGGVEIIRHADIQRAAALPLFRNATERLENLYELCDMLNARLPRKLVSPKEKKIILKLHEKGLSYGKIGLNLWENYGISRSHSTIGRIVRQNKNNSNE